MFRKYTKFKICCHNFLRKCSFTFFTGNAHFCLGNAIIYKKKVLIVLIDITIVWIFCTLRLQNASENMKGVFTQTHKMKTILSTQPLLQPIVLQPIDLQPIDLQPGPFVDRPGHLGKPVEIPLEYISDLTKVSRTRIKMDNKRDGFNQYASDLIGISRSLPDSRDDWCKASDRFLKDLPSTSIIIPFHNEPWSSLLRTVYSVIDNSPPQLIHEIILVDDFSDLAHLQTQLKDQLINFSERENYFRAFKGSFEINGLELKDLEMKGLEMKGLEMKDLEMKGLEYSSNKDYPTLTDPAKIKTRPNLPKAKSPHRQLPTIKLIRTNKREGPIRAKYLGTRQATGKVLTFLDSHCECGPGWLEPLLDRIARNSTVVALPIIDYIDKTTFEYQGLSTDSMKITIFDWTLYPMAEDIPEREKTRRVHPAEPYFTPIMPEGLFSISRDFFVKLGRFDSWLEDWGGENFEMSFKAWMCGGCLEFVPCSHVGHVFRTRKDKRDDEKVRIMKQKRMQVMKVKFEQQHHVGFDEENIERRRKARLEKKRLEEERLQKEKTQFEKTPFEKTPFDKTPFEKTPFEKTPFKKTTFKKTPFENTPFEKTPFKKTTFKKTPFEKTPLEKTPFEKTPFKKTPFEKTPFHKSPLKHSMNSKLEEVNLEETRPEEEHSEPPEFSSLSRNLARVAEIWMDDFAHYYYEVVNRKYEFDDISSRNAMKESMNCKNFEWYLKNVIPELSSPTQYLSWGAIKNLAGNVPSCLEYLGKFEDQPGVLPCHGMHGNQHFFMTKAGEIRQSHSCLDFGGAELFLVRCNLQKKGRIWRYSEKTKLLFHEDSQMCLTLSTDKKVLSMTKCNEGDEHQRWVLENYKGV